MFISVSNGKENLSQGKSTPVVVTCAYVAEGHGFHPDLSFSVLYPFVNFSYSLSADSRGFSSQFPPLTLSFFPS